MTTPRLSLPLVLASGSPRRRELLTRAGIDFEIEPADIDETQAAGEAALAYALRMARGKAEAVAGRRRERSAPACIVLGSDTIVVLGERVLGKPRDARHAEELLGALVGREHVVITAIAAVTTRPDAGACETAAVHSRVAMREAAGDEIREYVATGEPLDKAGAYAVQGEGRRFISEIDGSETNVIGLPVAETLALLTRVGAA